MHGIQNDAKTKLQRGVGWGLKVTNACSKRSAYHTNQMPFIWLFLIIQVSILKPLSDHNEKNSEDMAVLRCVMATSESP